MNPLIRPSMTIGVPTYNRGSTVEGLTISASSFASESGLSVLVLDDGSGDDTNARLGALQAKGYQFRFESNRENLGYAQTFSRLFELCDTEYLLVMADDDLMIERGVSESLGCLARKPYSFVCTQWLQAGRVYRGLKYSRRMSPSDFLCARHAPGLIYRVQDTIEARCFLQERLSLHCLYAQMYPQVLVLLHMLLNRKMCCYQPIATAAEGSSMQSGIVDEHGDTYYSLRSRLRQAACFDEIVSAFPLTNELAEVISAAGVDHLSGIYDKFPSHIRKRFFRKILGRELEQTLWTPVKKRLRKMFKTNA